MIWMQDYFKPHIPLKYRVTFLHFKCLYDCSGTGGCISLIKSDSKYIYNVTKDLYLKQMLFKNLTRYHAHVLVILKL